MFFVTTRESVMISQHVTRVHEKPSHLVSRDKLIWMSSKSSNFSRLARRASCLMNTGQVKLESRLNESRAR